LDDSVPIFEAVVTAQISVVYTNFQATPSHPLKLNVAHVAACHLSLIEFSGVFYQPGSITTDAGGVAELILKSSYVILNSSSLSVFCHTNQKYVEIESFARFSSNVRLNINIPALLQGYANFSLNVMLNAACTLTYKFYILMNNPRGIFVAKNSTPALFASKGPREVLIYVHNIYSDSPEQISLVSDGVSLNPEMVVCSAPTCFEASLLFIMPALSLNTTFVLIRNPFAAAVDIRVISDPVALTIFSQLVLNDAVGLNSDALIEMRLGGLVSANSSDFSVSSDFKNVSWRFVILQYTPHISKVLVIIGTSFMNETDSPISGVISLPFTLRYLNPTCTIACELNSRVDVNFFAGIVIDFVFPHSISEYAKTADIFMFVRNLNKSIPKQFSATSSNAAWSVKQLEVVSDETQTLSGNSLVVLSLLKNGNIQLTAKSTQFSVSSGFQSFSINITHEKSPTVAYVFPVTLTPYDTFHLVIDNFPPCTTAVNVSFQSVSLPASWFFLQAGDNQSLIQCIPPFIHAKEVNITLSIVCESTQSLWSVNAGVVPISQVARPVISRIVGASPTTRGAPISVEVVGVPSFWQPDTLLVLIGGVLCQATYSYNEDSSFQKSRAIVISILTPDLSSGIHTAQIFDAKNVDIMLIFDVTYIGFESPKILSIFPSQIKQFQSATFLITLLIPPKLSISPTDIDVRFLITDSASIAAYFELLSSSRISVFCPHMNFPTLRFFIRIQGYNMTSPAIHVIGTRANVESITPSFGFTSPFLLTVTASALFHAADASEVLAFVELDSQVYFLALYSFVMNVDGQAVLSFETPSFPSGGMALFSLRNVQSGVFLNFSYVILASSAMPSSYLPAITDSRSTMIDMKIEQFSVVMFPSSVRVSFCEQWLSAPDVLLLSSSKLFTLLRLLLPPCPSNKPKSLLVFPIREPSKSFFMIVPSQKYFDVLDFSPSIISTLTSSKVYISTSALVDSWQAHNATIHSTKLLDIGSSTVYLYMVEVSVSSLVVESFYLMAFNGSNSVTIQLKASNRTLTINSMKPSSGDMQGGYMIKLSPVDLNSRIASDFVVTVGATKLSTLQVLSNFIIFEMPRSATSGPVEVVVSDRNTSRFSSFTFHYDVSCNMEDFCSNFQRLPNFVLLASVNSPIECSINYCMSAELLSYPKISAISPLVGFASDFMTLRMSITDIVAVYESDVILFSTRPDIAAQISGVSLQFSPPYSRILVHAVVQSLGYVGDAKFSIYSKLLGPRLNVSFTCSFLPKMFPDSISVTSIAPAQTFMYQDVISLLVSVSNILTNPANIVDVAIDCLSCSGTFDVFQMQVTAVKTSWSNASLQININPLLLKLAPFVTSVIHIQLNSSLSRVGFNVTVLPMLASVTSIFPSILSNIPGSTVRVQFVGLYDYNSSDLCIFVGGFALSSTLDTSTKSSIRFLAGTLSNRLPLSDDPPVLHRVQIGKCLSKQVLVGDHSTLMLTRPLAPRIVSIFPAQLPFTGDFITVSLTNVRSIVNIYALSKISSLHNITLTRRTGGDFEWLVGMFFVPGNIFGQTTIVIHCFEVTFLRESSLSFNVEVLNPPPRIHPTVISAKGGSIVTVSSFAFRNQPISEFAMRIINSESQPAILSISTLSTPGICILRLPAIKPGLHSVFITVSENVPIVSVEPLQVALLSSVIEESVPLSLTAIVNFVQDEDVLFFEINGVLCSSQLISFNSSARQVQIFLPPLVPGGYVLKTSLFGQSGISFFDESRFRVLTTKPSVSLFTHQDFVVLTAVHEIVICRGLGNHILSVTVDSVPVPWNSTFSSAQESVVQIVLNRLQSGTRSLSIIGSLAAVSMSVAVYDNLYSCNGPCRLTAAGGAIAFEGITVNDFDTLDVTIKGLFLKISSFLRTQPAKFQATVLVPPLTIGFTESKRLTLAVSVQKGNFVVSRGVIEVSIVSGPVASAASFNGDGSKIIIEFDQNISLPSQCDEVFASQSVQRMGLNPLCGVSSASRFTVALGFGSQFQPGDTIFFSDILSLQSILVSAPHFFHSPDVHILGPTSFSTCNPIVLTAVVTSSREARFSWYSIDGTPTIAEFLSSQQESVVVIFPYVFKSMRSVTIVVKATTFGAVSEASLQMFAADQVAPVITFYPLAKSAFTVDDGVFISAKIEKSECYPSTDFPTKYSWSCENCPAQFLEASSKYLSYGSSEMYFPAGTLKPHDYRFRLLVSTAYFSSSATETVRVIRRPIRIILIGGNQTVSTDIPTVLNASATIDPDGDSRDLMYTWICSASGTTICRMNDGKKLVLTGPVPVFPVSQMPSATYSFVLIAASLDGRSSSAEFSISVVRSSIPRFGILLTPEVVLPHQSLLIKVNIACSDCRFSWKVTAGNFELVESVLDKNVGGPASSMLRILPGMLVASAFYEFEVTVINSNGAVASSKRSFIVNSAPSGGSCSISATQGRSDDIFVISCIRWRDDHLPIRYDLGISNSVNVDSFPLLTPFSDGDVFKVSLPNGKWNLTVSICNCLKSCTFYTLPAVVIFPNVAASKMFLQQKANTVFSVNALQSMNFFMDSVLFHLIGLPPSNFSVAGGRSLLQAGTDSIIVASDSLIRYIFSLRLRASFAPDSGLRAISLISDVSTLIFLRDSIAGTGVVNDSFVLDCFSAINHVWSSSNLETSSEPLKSGLKSSQFIDAVYDWLQLENKAASIYAIAESIHKLSALSSNIVGKQMIPNQMPILLSSTSSRQLYSELHRLAFGQNISLSITLQRFSPLTASFSLHIGGQSSSDAFVEASTTLYSWPFRTELSPSTIIVPGMHSVFVYDSDGSLSKVPLSVSANISLPSSFQVWQTWSLKQRAARIKVAVLDLKSKTWNASLCKTVSVSHDRIQSSCSAVSSFAVIADPAISVCGDQDIQFPEECDDGNENNGDGCSSSCRHEIRSCTCTTLNCTFCVEVAVTSASGGVFDVQVPSGRVRIQFPPQAINEDAIFKISSSTEIVSSKSINTREELILRSEIFSFEPSIVFLKPVNLTLPISKGALFQNVFFYSFDNSTMSWKRESTNQIIRDPFGRSVSDLISHFSSWAVFESNIVESNEPSSTYSMPSWLIAVIIVSGLVLIFGYPLAKFVQGRLMSAAVTDDAGADVMKHDDMKHLASIVPAVVVQEAVSLDEDEIVVGGDVEEDPTKANFESQYKTGKIADMSFWNQQHMVLSDSFEAPKLDDKSDKSHEESDASLDALSLVFEESTPANDAWESFLEDIDAQEISVEGVFSPSISVQPQIIPVVAPLPPEESRMSRLQRLKETFAGSSAAADNSSQQAESDAPFIRTISQKYSVATALATSVQATNSNVAADASEVDGSRFTAHSDRLRAIARARIEQAQQRARARQVENANDAPAGK
jgi:cysteine-rich repeat protein